MHWMPRLGPYEQAQVREIDRDLRGIVADLKRMTAEAQAKDHPPAKKRRGLGRLLGRRRHGGTRKGR